MKTSETVTLTHDGLEFSGFQRLPSGGSSRAAVLIMHGFPDDHRSFEGLADHLAGAGYHVIVPVMRGYEPSSQAKGAYHVSSLASDAVAWLDHLGIRRAHLVGHDWGAVVAYAAASLDPGRVRSVTALAVPHPRRLVAALRHTPQQLRNSWYMGFFQLPLLPERALRRGLVERLWRQWSPGWEPGLDILAQVHARFAMPGVVEGALGYYRALRRSSTPEGQRTRALLRGPIDAPTLAMTGANDGCMATALFDRSMVADDFPAGLRVERLDRAGHWLHLEQPHTVHTMIATWLLRSDS